MGKKIKVKILDIDNLKFELEENGIIGDYIDLGKLEEINFQSLRKSIDETIKKFENLSIQEYIKSNQDRLYDEWKKSDNEFKELIQKKEELKELKLNSINKINQLKKELENKDSSIKEIIKNTKNEVELNYKDQLNNNKVEIEKLTLQKNNIEEITIAKQKEFYEEQIRKLENTKRDSEINLKNDFNEKINTLNNELDKKNLEQQLKIKEVEENSNKKHQEEIEKLNEDVIFWKEKRNSQNVKEIGEELENFINSEFQKSMGFLEDVSLLKTTKDINGTKPDFKFIIYKDATKKEPLTSVVIEAKSESLNAKTLTKNAQHFDKLEKDRINNNGEYALLISELEKSTDDPFILTRANVEGKQYPNMFITRPQYFITFLMLIYNLTQGKKDIIDEEINFMKNKDILNEFEVLKNQIINDSLKKVEEKIKKSITLAEDINKKANTIIENLEKSLGRSNLETVKNKINEFKITKLTKKIEEIENESI